MKEKGKKWLMIFRLIGIVLFIVLLFKMDIKEIWENLKKINIGSFLLAVLLQIIMLMIKSYRWFLLRNELQKKSNIFFSFGTFLESYAFGVVTPGRIGELVKSGYESNKLTKWQSLFKIIAERGFDLGIFIIIAGVSTYYLKLLPINNFLTVLIIFGGISLIGLSLLLLSDNKTKIQIEHFIFLKIFKSSSYSKFQYNINSKRLLSIFLLSIMANLATFYSCYLLTKGINLGSNFLFVSGGVAITGLINLLPISIMGIGTREMAFLYIFHTYDQSLILAFSFLMFLVVQIGGGLLALVMGQIFIYIYKKLNKSNAYA